jgi:hypothetical protein
MNKKFNLFLDCLFLSMMLPITLRLWGAYYSDNSVVFGSLSVIVTALVMARFIQIIKQQLKDN